VGRDLVCAEVKAAKLSVLRYPKQGHRKVTTLEPTRRRGEEEGWYRHSFCEGPDTRQEHGERAMRGVKGREKDLGEVRRA